ncbi:MAG: ComEC/Rec2 family competence protein [Pyrinomonadaceae bacterium]
MDGGQQVDATFDRDSRSVGEAVVSEHLWSRGLSRIDYILATHADADHIDGLNDIARNFRVGAALVARTPATDFEFSKFSATCNSRGVPIYSIGAGDVLRFGAAKVRVLWPPATAIMEAPSQNNDSLVLLLQFGARRVLFTGDIEDTAEKEILTRYKTDLSDLDPLGSNLRADVVKVAHHGSKTSSSEGFVTATQSHIAVISVGQTSVFGHPHHDVVERWKKSGAQVITTGENGMISLTTDGRDLGLTTFVGSESSRADGRRVVPY